MCRGKALAKTKALHRIYLFYGLVQNLLVRLSYYLAEIRLGHLALNWSLS